MSKSDNQLLIIDPQHELKFRGPFHTTVTTSMVLSNPTDKTILFKIKTTVPKRYCVRPNCGTLLPTEQAEILISLQPSGFDPNEKNKHKFMIQSLIAPEGEYDTEQVWKKVSPDQLMDSKLRCVFEVQVDDKVNQARVSQATTALISNEAQIADTSNIATNNSTTGSSNLSSGDDKLLSNLKSNQEIAMEIRQLREDDSKMRQENLQLKEEILRLKMQAQPTHQQQSQSSKPAVTTNPYSAYSPPSINQQQQLPIIYIIAAIGMAIFGVVLGKFIL